MKKFLMLIVAMLFMSVASFSQITISQEDYDRLLERREPKSRK